MHTMMIERNDVRTSSPNAQVALPSVNNQIEQKEGKKPALKLDKKQQKKKAAEKALQEEEENEASSLKANPFLNKKNNKK